ncbi:MAG: signal peptidase I, partial [Candidatus Thermoplasmatota archaeon]|nr:signal peptidase I [Candidatus Thermoplasmatota archaeon]
IIIYIITNQILQEAIEGSIVIYVVNTILWIFLAFLVFLIAKHEGLNIWNFKKIRKWQIGRTPAHAALLIGGFQVSLLILAGLFVGFGVRSYSFTPLFILINIISLVFMLLGIEFSRAYLIKKGTFRRRSITLTLGLVTILFTLIYIPLSQFTLLDVSYPAASAKFFGETIIPLLAVGLFASYLAYLGGAMAAIGYMGILQTFKWFSPVVPDLNWISAALIGTLAPAIGFLLIQNSIQSTPDKHGRWMTKKKTKDPAISWIGVAIVSILILFFSFGFFGVQPMTIISGSMQPVLDVGDVVIISDVPVDEIQEGDIIQYRGEDAAIIHRVYEIRENKHTKLFITKGDANENPDPDPVSQGQIMGKAVFTVPKIGWISIALKEVFRNVGVTR